MESAAYTDQTLLAEVLALRQRVAALEQNEAKNQQSDAESVQQIEASRHMDESLGIISHELKNPLTAINGNIQLAKHCLQALPFENHTAESLQERYDLITEMLSRAERQVRVQNRLVNDLLDVSRLQSDQLALTRELHDMLTLVRETTEDIRASIPRRTITLTLPDINAIPVLIDRDRIGQVLTNYLTNALKYSLACQPVIVRIELNDRTVRISVQDKGPGITPEELAQVWQRFYKVPNIRVRNGSSTGLGLGLYICRSIIEHHGGQVGVESQPGDGSTFWFTLPLVQA